MSGSEHFLKEKWSEKLLNQQWFRGFACLPAGRNPALSARLPSLNPSKIRVLGQKSWVMPSF
jgi:hypothetical protein